ncbi:hypothetical protein Tco_0454524 [Tanacetum coccineum]
MTDSDHQELKFYEVSTTRRMLIMLVRYRKIFNTKLTTGSQRSEDVRSCPILAYNTLISLSTSLIPPKIERGKGVEGSNATITPKKTTEASKKKKAKKIESSDKESEKQQEGMIRRKLKGIELLSDATQLEIDTQKAIKASKCERRSKHQSGGSSEGAGIKPKVPDEPTGKSTVLDEGAGTSPEVPDETKDKSKAQDDLEDWGSTDDETFLFDDKEEKPEDIPWVSTDEDKSDDDDDEDDESIDIEMTDDEKTDTDVEDQVKGVAEMTIVEEAEEENVEKVEELKADEEQQGDDQVRDEQVGVPLSTTHKEKPNLLQSTSGHSVSSNFAPPLPATVILSALIPDPEAFNDVVQRVSKLEKEVKELKQVDHSSVILKSIKSEVPEAVNKYLGSNLGDTLQKALQRHTKELRQKLSQKTISQIRTEDLNLQVSRDNVSKFIKVKQERVAQEKMPKYSTTPYDQAAKHEHKSLLVDKNDIDKLAVDPASQRKRRHGDKDQDPPAGSDQEMKKRRTRKDAEHLKKSSKSKESAKGKTPSNTSKTGKSVSTDKSVHEPNHVVQMDVEEPNLDIVANDADKPQANAIPKIPKKDCFKKSPRLKILDPDWNTVKTVDDALEQSWFNKMIQAEKPPLTFDELMSTPIDFSTFAMNRLKLNKITRADLVGPVFNLLKGTCKSCVELEYNMEECYRALTDQLEWTNLEGHKRSVDMSKPLPLQDKEGRLTIPVEYFFNYDLENLQVGNKERTYSSSISKTPVARYTMEGIKDMIPTLWSPVKIAYDKDVALGISH